MVRYLNIILFLLLVFPCTYVSASDCRVVEYPDRSEVVCEGNPADKTSKPMATERQIEDIKQQRDQVQKALIAEQKNADDIAKKIQDKKTEIEEMKKKFAEDNKRFREQRGQ